MNTLYQAQATASGGRTGNVSSDDGRLTLTLDTPKELGGQGGSGTNPEQLFAAGYSACFLSALKYVAAQKKLELPTSTAVRSAVNIGLREDKSGFRLEISLNVTIPNMARDVAKTLIAQADEVCPYSHLARHGTAVHIDVG